MTGLHGLYGGPARSRPRGPSPLLALLAGVGLTLAAVAGGYWFALRAPEPRFDRNAVWLGVTWVNDPHAEEEIRLLAEHLKANAVRYAFVYVSYLRVDTTAWNDTYDHARAFTRTFGAVAPEVKLLSWLGVPARSEDGTYRLGSASLRRQIGQFAARTIDQFGFDGVHLNIESVVDGNEDFLALVEEVRDQIGPDVLLSVAVPPDWNPGRPDVPAGPDTEVGTVWTADYKRDVGARVDQVVVMAYNSGLETATDYEIWVAYQVEQFTTALADLDAEVELIIGVPTFADAPGHDERAESLRAALNGVRDGTQRAGDRARIVGGVGLYAFWDTDAVEWALYRDGWLFAEAPSSSPEAGDVVE